MASASQSASQRLHPLAALLLPSVGNIVFVSTLAVLLMGVGNGLLFDGDTGYHIRAGEEILKHWTVPSHDIFSFHVPPLKWTAHEWLSEIIFAVVYQLTGLTGIVIFVALVLAATHWLLYSILARKFTSLSLVILTTLLATATSSSHWLARPHVFSLLLTTIWYHLLDRFQYEHHNALRYLPVIMIFWVNLHGGYFFGLVLMCLYLIGNLVSSFAGSPELSKERRNKANFLFRYLILTIATCAVNPLGFEILLFPLKITSDRFVMDRVIEFLSPNFHDPLPFKYMLLATIGAVALARRPMNLIECTVLLLVSYMALYSARYMSLFAILIAPLLLKCVESALDESPALVTGFLRRRDQNLASINRQVHGYLWPIGSILLALGLGLMGGLRFTFDDKRFPVAAVSFLSREPIKGKMFNNDEFGDYIIFSAWPSYRVFMDGRSDMYGAKWGSAYLQIANVQPGWDEVLAQNGITWVIFDTKSALTAALQNRPEWQPIYSDSVATIFLKKTAEHATLLEKYASVEVATQK